MDCNVVLNWYGEIHSFLIQHVDSEKEAKKKAIAKFAIKVGRTRYVIRQHVYSGNKISCHAVNLIKI